AGPAHTQSSPRRSRPPPALPNAAAFPANSKKPAAQTSVPAAACCDQSASPPDSSLGGTSIAILINEAFFITISFCLFIIVECGVPLAHSTTHDIYSYNYGPFLSRA
ncbi:MAG: hypothetical protein WBV90_17400, partial [Terrimicrobiaceae bacterium]